MLFTPLPRDHKEDHEEEQGNNQRQPGRRNKEQDDQNANEKGDRQPAGVREARHGKLVATRVLGPVLNVAPQNDQPHDDEIDR